MDQQSENNKPTRKKRILVDFDGTLNGYQSGFNREEPWHLPDPPIDGAMDFLRMLFKSELYEVAIFTTRVWGWDSRTVRKIQEEMKWWLTERGGLEPEIANAIPITHEKLPCSLIIDDNAWRFTGTYPTADELHALIFDGRHR